MKDMKKALTLLDSYLLKKVTIYICGGTAISLRFGARPTADVDVIEPPIFGDLAQAAKKVANSATGKELGLPENWLNDSVESMIKISQVLPSGWRDRAQKAGPIFSGKFLTVVSLALPDLIKTKLLAMISPDRGADALQDLEDIKTMRPNAQHLAEEAVWLFEAHKHYEYPTSKDLIFFQKFIQENIIDEIYRDA